MKKILGVIGSPRRNGNTHLLVQKILEGAEQAGAEVEAVLLADFTIRECDGCFICWKGKPCPKRDDMNELYPKISAADVIVFGTPVYWFGPSALLKAFLDRFVYFNCRKNRPQIRGKSAVLAAPFEDTSLKTAAPLQAMMKLSFDYLEMKMVGKILVPGVGRKGEILKKKAALKQAYELGRKIAG